MISINRGKVHYKDIYCPAKDMAGCMAYFKTHDVYCSVKVCRRGIVKVSLIWTV